jgi:aquaporin Z
MREAIRDHWPEYLIEAAGLGAFMVSATLFGVLLFHPAGPVSAVAMPETARRALMGLAMGATAVGLIYSPFGRRSGAHLNPAVTLTFWRLGKVRGWDATFYVLAQTLGGVLGMLFAATALPGLVAHPSVAHVVTVPGRWGTGAAWAGELLISAGLMTVVLAVSSRPRLASFTGLCAGGMVALWITVEAPVSGMSMNPARTLASAVSASTWTAFWVYLTAPPLGMLAAAEIHRRAGAPAVPCAKLQHDRRGRCIFRCGAHDPARDQRAPAA